MTQDQEKKWRTPLIPFLPTADGIIVEDIEVKSEIRKKGELANIKRSDEEIRMDELRAFKGGAEAIKKTFHEHPAQARIVAVGPNVEIDESFRVGAIIAYGVMDESNLFIFDKKIYMKLNLYNVIGVYKSTRR